MKAGSLFDVGVNDHRTRRHGHDHRAVCGGREPLFASMGPFDFKPKIPTLTFVQVESIVFSDFVVFNPDVRPDVVLPREQQIIGNNRDVDKGTPYLNPAAFVNPPRTANDVPLHLGNGPPYLPNLRGFAFLSEDFSLIKRTAFGTREATSFEIRSDVTNLFNRIGIDNPCTFLGDPDSFGRVFGWWY